MFAKTPSYKCLLFTTMLCALSCASQISYAQKEEVPPRILKEFDGFSSNPMNIGSFYVTPILKLEQGYNTNVFATRTDEKSDFVTTIEPSISILKEVRDHQFKLNAKSTLFRYRDNNEENIENYDASFKGLLNATSRIEIPIEATYRIGHKLRLEERTARANSPAKPTKFKALKLSAGLIYNPNRMTVQLKGTYDTSRNENGKATTGARIVREDGDFDRMTGEAIVRYETYRQWSPFIKLVGSQADFKKRSFNGTSFGGTARDNFLFRALAGLGFDYKGIVFGDIAVGRDWRNYTDDDVTDISDTSLEANVTWQPLSGTSILFAGSRETEEDNEINNGLVETQFSAELDYELQQDLFLKTFGRYENNDFANSTRTDDIYSVGAGLAYTINPRFQLGGDIVYNTRDSNQLNANFDQTKFLIRLLGSL